MRIELDVSDKTASRSDVQQHARLVDAAQRFEGMLLQELLKPVQSGKDDWGTEDPDTDHSADTLSGFGTEAVANAISKNGGLGIARRIIQQVSRESYTRPK